MCGPRSRPLIFSDPTLQQRKSRWQPPTRHLESANHPQAFTNSSAWPPALQILMETRSPVNSRDVCIVNCVVEVSSLKSCLDRRDAAAATTGSSEALNVDCMPDIVRWKDCCEKAKYKELEGASESSGEGHK